MYPEYSTNIFASLAIWGFLAGSMVFLLAAGAIAKNWKDN